MQINITFDSSWNAQLFNAGPMESAIRSIASFFDAHIDNPITVNLVFGYGEVNGTAMKPTDYGESYHLGKATYTYEDIKTDYNVLSLNTNNADLNTAVFNLPANDPTGGTSFEIARPEAKLFGILTANDSTTDGYVGVANNVTWDLDNRDGVTAGSVDLFGSVAHEISETLGRYSDLNTPYTKPDGTHVNLDTPFDLFRYTTVFRPPTVLHVHDFTSTHPDYFSIDGGNTDLNDFNTNPSYDFGDWATSAGNDSFLAQSPPSAINAFTPADATVMSALGYDFTNQDPTAANDAASVQEYGAVTGNVITGGVGGAGADTDPEGDRLTVTGIEHFDPASHHLFIGTVGSPMAGTYGFMTIDQYGNYTYEAASDVAVPRGTTGSDTFIYLESDGLGGTSQASITVTVHGADPLITSIDWHADDGPFQLGPGRVLTINIAASEAVNVTGAPSIGLSNNGVATYQGGSGTKLLTFAYTVQPGDDTPDLQIVGLALPPGSSIADTTGNSLAGGVIDDLNITVDTTPPPAPLFSGISPGTGAIPAGPITDQSSVTVAGTAEIGDSVSLYEGATLIGQANVDNLGNWSIDNILLAAGANDFTAVATDFAGNSASSGAFEVTRYTDSAWANPVSGNWSKAANWSPAALPGLSSNADLVAGHYTVTDARPTEVFSLTVGSGATLKLTGGTFTDDHGSGPGVNDGTIKIESSATLAISGAMADTGAGRIMDDTGGTIDLNGGAITGGKLAVAAGATLEATGGAASSIATGNLITNAGTVGASGGSTLTITDAIRDAAGGVLLADGGTLILDGAVTGSGSATITDGGTLDLHGAATLTSVGFAGAGLLVLDDPHDLHGTIAGFGAGDTIDLTSILYSNAHGSKTVVKYTDDGTGQGGTLLVRDSSGDIAKLAMTGSYVTQNFLAQDDGAGHAAVHFNV